MPVPTTGLHTRDISSPHTTFTTPAGVPSSRYIPGLLAPHGDLRSRGAGFARPSVGYFFGWLNLDAYQHARAASTSPKY